MFIDSANIEEISKSLELGIIKGITTNPSILKKEKEKRAIQLEKISKFNTKIIYVQVIGLTKKEMFEDYLKIVELGKRFNVKFSNKVPISMEGLKAINEIRKDDPKVNILGTAIYSADQGILASIAGCNTLAPYVNRMEDNNIDAFGEISKMRTFIDDRNLDTQIIAASFKNISQITKALEFGAHTCTIPYNLLDKMLNKDVVEAAIEKFNNDGMLYE